MPSSFNVGSAEGYEQLMGRWSRRLAPGFIDFAGLRDGESVLDVGCGTGSLTFALAGHAGLKAISAIDFSPVFVEAASRRNRDPRVTIRQADACALPFADASFDILTSIYLFHEVPPPIRREIAREFARVLKPGGLLVFMDSLQTGDTPEFDAMLESFPANFHEPFYNGYLRDDLRQIFTEAGLQVVDTEPVFLSKRVVANKL